MEQLTPSCLSRKLAAPFGYAQDPYIADNRNADHIAIYMISNYKNGNNCFYGKPNTYLYLYTFFPFP